MGASLLITLREGFEAALVVAIVLAFVKRSDNPEMGRWVWMGTAAATALAIVVGLILHLTIDGLTGEARSRTFAAICLAAAALLTWMIFWMRTHSRNLKGELEGKTAAAIASSGSALFLVAFLAVAREGLETALFLISTTTDGSGAEVVIGALLGLAIAIVLGVLIYQGSRKLNLRRFFQVTGVLIILFAAGLMSKAVLFLQGNTVDVVYNVTGIRWLTNNTETGKFLAGIFGWDPAPSVLQFVAYFGYLVPALVFFFWQPKKKAPAVSVPPAEPKEPVPA